MLVGAGSALSARTLALAAGAPLAAVALARPYCLSAGTELQSWRGVKEHQALQDQAWQYKQCFQATESHCACSSLQQPATWSTFGPVFNRPVPHILAWCCCGSSAPPPRAPGQCPQPLFCICQQLYAS